MNDPAIDEEEVQPRFLLTGPVRVDVVAAVLAALQPAGLIVGVGWDRRLLDLAREHGAALLVEDHVDPEADGVHLTDPRRAADLRAKLDRDPDEQLILGADVRLSRHDAMVAGEAGADYVAFGDPARSADDAVVELVGWWRAVTVLPCLAHAEDAETVARLAMAGADFIGVSKAIWRNPEGSAAAARDLAAALDKS